MSEDLDFDMEVVENHKSESFRSSKEKENYIEESKTPVSDWQGVQLREVVHRRSENVDPGDTDLDRHVGLEHISSGDPVPNFGSVDGQSSTKRHFLPGDVLFGKLRPYLEKVSQPDFEGLCTSEIFSIVAEEAINAKFLLYRLSSKRAIDYAVRTSIGTRMPRTSWGLFENFEFELPPLPEQRKIASVLYTVDQAIRKTEAIIEQAKRVKQGFTEDIWTYGLHAFRGSDELTRESEHCQETTVGRFPNKWEIVNLDSITERVTDGSHQAVETLPDDEEGVPFLYVSCIRDGQIRWDKASSISEEVYEDISAGREPEAGVILYTAVRSYGHAVLLEGDKRLSFQRHIAYIRPDSSRVDPNFLAHWLDGKRAKKYASRVAQGNAQKTVTLHDLSRYPIPIPKRETQERIAVFLDQFDEWIRTEKKTKDRLNRLKSGLMQDLLTGEVRTTGKAIEVLDEVKAHE